MTIIKGAAVIVINNKNEYLLLKRSHKAPHHAGQWESVGGKLEAHETFEACARREALEEAGVSIQEMTEVAHKRFHDDEQDAELEVVIFVSRIKDGVMPAILERDVFSELRWFTKDELASLKDMAYYARQDFIEVGIIEDVA